MQRGRKAGQFLENLPLTLTLFLHDPCTRFILGVIGILSKKLPIFRPFYTLSMHRRLTNSSILSCYTVDLHYSQLEPTFGTKFKKSETKNSVPTHGAYNIDNNKSKFIGISNKIEKRPNVQI